MKKLKKAVVCCVLAAGMLVSVASPVFANRNWITLNPKQYKFAVEAPHNGPDTGKWHVHVNNGNTEIGAGGVNGTESHKDNLYNVPNSITKQIKADPAYKRAQEKQKELDKAEAEKAKKEKDALDKAKKNPTKMNAAKKEINSRGLKLNKKADVIIAAGLVIAAMGTVFFPADDFVAWANLFRALGW